MVGHWHNAQVIDLGDDITTLSYFGNTLSDAQIALGLFGDEYKFGIEGQSEEFLKWALSESNGISYNGLPENVQFICDRDIMYHPNNGVIGLRMDFVEDAFIENVVIKRLINKSPLSSYACSDSSRHGMGTDTKGISISASNVIFDGFNNVIEKLISYNGNVVALHIKDDAQIVFDVVYKDELSQNDELYQNDDRSALHIKHLCPGHDITFALLAELMVDGMYPNPNNFKACNVLIENKKNSSMSPSIPNGLEKLWCAQYVPQNVHGAISDVMAVDFQTNKKQKEEQKEDPVFAANGIGINDKRILNHLDQHTNINNYDFVLSLYIIIGVFCVIMIIFVLVTFIMKCSHFFFGNNNKRNNKRYKPAKYEESTEDESDLTEDEQI